MFSAIRRYASWLHLQWPAGKVERLPKVGEHGRTNIQGVRIVGDLNGVPLLKFSLDSGTRAVHDLRGEIDGRQGEVDVAIIGAGVSGAAAAVACAEVGLSYRLIDSAQLFSTIVNFPVGKPIYTYPEDMTPQGELQVSAATREALLEELRDQAREHGIEVDEATATHLSDRGDGLTVHLKEGDDLEAKAAIVAIGRSGNFRRMGVPGEDLDKVSNRLIDPKQFCGQRVAVIGGGDSACEAAIALAEGNCDEGIDQALVTLAYRGAELSRPKPDNKRRVEELAAEGLLDLRLGTEPTAIGDHTITLTRKGGEEERLDNDAVLALIGREAPLDFFRRSGLRVHGEYTPQYLLFIIGFLCFVAGIYAMKMFGLFGQAGWNPVTWARDQVAGFGPGHDYSLLDTVIASMSNGFGFYITLLYCLAVIGFSLDRIVRRRTPYVTVQTITLTAIQCLPLFLLPEIILPYLGHQGAFDGGFWGGLADQLFPAVDYDANGREYWRAYGFILAWPLFVWNVFTSNPLTAWLVISLVQTFLIIPAMIYFWGKGAYCGWICSCGALAETMGDRHREKMPHGPFWNRLNLLGQVILLIAFGLLILRVISWTTGSLGGLNALLLIDGWKPVVDYLLAGVLGLGLYFWLSGRTWCRFACPLAALMHIYHRFSRFRIIPETKKCISCNVCTSVCHQGIDVMSFANKGAHMADPQCVRCSACVQSCPTGVLQFGQVDREGKVIKLDGLRAKVAGR